MIPVTERGLRWVPSSPEEGAGHGFAHRSLLYASREEFLAATLPLVERGRERGEPVLAVLGEEAAGTLRPRLGGRVDLVSSSDWYRHPMRTLAALHGYVRDRLDRGASRVRVIAEPPWDGRGGQEALAWTHVESLLNAALAGAPVSMLCPYDRRSTPTEIQREARRTHSEVVEGGREAPSPLFTAPETYTREVHARLPFPEPPEADRELFFADELGRARRFVTARAGRAGMGPDRRYDLAVAANEIITNALKYGDVVARVRLWTDGGNFVCEVADAGGGLRDPLAGYLPPAVGQFGGRGLWLARQLCDRVALRTGPSGTAVRLTMGLDGPDRSAYALAC